MDRKTTENEVAKKVRDWELYAAHLQKMPYMVWRTDPTTIQLQLLLLSLKGKASKDGS